MYPNTNAVFRGDLTGGIVEQASGWESGLIGLKALPVINVDTKAGQYPVFQLAAGDALRNTAAKRAPGTKHARGTRSYHQDTYATDEYTWEEPIDDVDSKDMARYFNMELLAAKLGARKVALAHEIRAAALLFNTTTFPTTAPTVAYTYANIATIDVGYDVELALDRLRQVGEDSNNASVIMSGPVFLRVRASTKLQNRLRGIGVSSDSILNVSEAAVAEALGVKEVLVGKCYYDGSLEGEAFSSTAIWSNTYIWVGNVGTAGGKENLFGGGCAFTLNWGQYGPPMAVETYRDETISSDVVRAKQHVTEKVVNANAGELIATTYS